MMNDTDVGSAMQRLPRTKASPRFTAEVIGALNRAPRSVMPWRIVTATAITLTLVAGSYAASVHYQRQQHMQALRIERQRIESELRQVKSVVNNAQPVVVLENGDTRVIVDLDDHRNPNQQAKLIYY
jgi:hypothetical protein